MLVRWVAVGDAVLVKVGVDERLEPLARVGG
jgi:hypothetical protein